jgi:hypothetical protein
MAKVVVARCSVFAGRRAARWGGPRGGVRVQTAGVGATADGRPFLPVNPDLTGGDGGSFQRD